MTTITGLHAREILDSRGIPTLEADVMLKSGSRGRASVPSDVPGQRDGDPTALRRKRCPTSRLRYQSAKFPQP